MFVERGNEPLPTKCATLSRFARAKCVQVRVIYIRSVAARRGIAVCELE
jgi:hypothetical protein